MTIQLRKKENTAERYLPYIRHADENTVITENRGAFQFLQLKGASFYTADNNTINSLHERLSNTLRQIADDNVMLYSYVVRRPDDEITAGDLQSDFGRWLNDSYNERLLGKRLFVNDLYVGVYVQPRGLSRLLYSKGAKRAGKHQIEVDRDIHEQLAEAISTLEASLERYSPRRLGLVENRRGYVCSEPLSLLRELISGQRGLVPLVDGPLGASIYTDRVLFGREAFEIRHSGSSTIGGILGIKDHAPHTSPHMLDELLSARFRFVLAQSFRFLNKGAQLDEMRMRQNRMANANDAGISQADELTDARDSLISNAFTMGEHNLSLMVLADTTSDKQRAMNEAARMLADNGMIVAREDLGLEAAFWAQLPSNHAHRLRPSRISSRNMASFSPFHNFPTGTAAGNLWGPAVAKLQTAAGGPYHMNFHKSDVGHTFVCGPTGSGKTVWQLFLMSQLEKFGCKRVLFDKDRGGAIFVRASGGDYLDFKNGDRTGCAPFKALPINEGTRPFFIDLIKSMLRDDQTPFTPHDLGRIERAVKSLEEIDQSERTISVLRELIGVSAGSGEADIGTRLEKWCEGGRLEWVFENESDSIGFEASLIGFDVTDFLETPEVRSPIMMYLLYRVRQLITGQRLAIFIDEFWKTLSDPAFTDFAKDLLKVLRKRNGFMVMGTQDPSDVISSPISRTIIQQCATSIFFPSDSAKKSELVEEFGLSHKEYEIVRGELNQGDFLLKRGRDSVVCKLDLRGQNEALNVLSGRDETNAIMDELTAEYGNDPQKWLPVFQERCRLTDN